MFGAVGVAHLAIRHTTVAVRATASPSALPAAIMDRLGGSNVLS